MKKSKLQVNPNSILIIYEGETEAEFYKCLIGKYVEPRKIRLNYTNLKGVYNINSKVEKKIGFYLGNKISTSFNRIHVFVAYDRDGSRETETSLNLKYLTSKFLFKGSRIVSINEIVATQDLESWFFHDLNGIYDHLKIPKKKRNLSLYPTPENTNHRVLSHLFHKHKSLYQKGKLAIGLIEKLDLNLIFANVSELQDAVNYMNRLYK